MRCWGAQLDINDGRALDLGSERGDNGTPSCILEREDLEWRECPQEIRVGRGT